MTTPAAAKKKIFDELRDWGERPLRVIRHEHNGRTWTLVNVDKATSALPAFPKFDAISAGVSDTNLCPCCGAGLVGRDSRTVGHPRLCADGRISPAPKTPGPRWTEHEIQILKSYYQKLGTEAVYRALGGKRSIATIRHQARRQGLSVRTPPLTGNRFPWTTGEDLALRKILPVDGLLAAYHALGRRRSLGAIRTRASLRGIPIKKCGSLYAEIIAYGA